MNIAERFAQTAGMFFAHEVARMPPPMPVPEQQTDIKNSRHANSKKAIETRKAKYGKSKMKRNTRDDMIEEGEDVETEGE